MTERPVVDITAAVGGWPHPWPNVAELAAVLPSDKWTLIGGLMAQLHVTHHGIDAVRPTNDIDIVLHIETNRGVPSATADALESIGYRLVDSVDPRNNTAHRFTRADAHIDIVTSGVANASEKVFNGTSSDGLDIVDVLIADHPSPRVEERLRGRDMVKIERGTQALRRTLDVRMEIIPRTITTVSVPRPFGAVILKAAAYRADSRDPGRHLFDAAALLACIEDPFAERENFGGSDRARLATLERNLLEEHPAWLRLPRWAREQGQGALRLLRLPD